MRNKIEEILKSVFRNGEQGGIEEDSVPYATEELTNLLTQQREEAVKEYIEEQAKSILEKGNPDWLLDSADGRISKKYKELLSQQREKGKE